MLRSQFTFSILCSLFFIGSAYADPSAYKLDLGLQVPGEKKMHAILIVKDGESGEIAEKTKKGEMFIGVTPTEGTFLGKSGILMKFVVGSIDKHGKKTVFSEPEVLVGEDQPARLKISSKSGKNELTLTITATRKDSEI